jgi:hypothetical protein
MQSVLPSIHEWNLSNWRSASRNTDWTAFPTPAPAARLSPACACCGTSWLAWRLRLRWPRRRRPSRARCERFRGAVMPVNARPPCRKLVPNPAKGALCTGFPVCCFCLALLGGSACHLPARLRAANDGRSCPKTSISHSKGLNPTGELFNRG